MPAYRSKLPASEFLAEDIAAGLNLDQIAARYAVSRDWARARIKALGMVSSTVQLHHPKEDNRRIVIEKRVSASEYGGVAYLKISLPRVGIHVAYRQDPRGAE